MAETKSKEIIAMADNTKVTTANANNARVKRFKATVDLSGQAINDTLVLAAVPKECVFLMASVTASVSLVSSTLSIDGTHIDPVTKAIVIEAGKYSAARAVTTAETPILFGKTSASGEREYDEVITATIAGAALPASGTLVIDLLFSSVA